MTIGEFSGLIILTALCINLGILIYVAYAKLEIVEERLNKCESVNFNKEAYKDAGLIGRALRLNSILIILTVPHRCSKNEIVDFKQVAAVPRNLKLWVQLPYLSSLLLCSALLAT